MAPANAPADLVGAIYAAFQKGDIPFILKQVAPQARWHQAATLPWGGDYRGPEGTAEFFQKLDANMETIGFEARENIAAGDQVFSFGSYSGKSRQTGRTGTADWMFRWQIRDGQIVSWESYIDTAALLSALG